MGEPAAGGQGTIASPPFVDGAYRSPSRRPSLFARALPGLRFYSLAGAIVWRASRLAVRGVYDDAAWSRSSFDILRALEAAGVRLEIDGVGHFASLGGPCVFVGNHMSTLETFVLPTIILSSGRMTYVVKRELTSYPVFGHVMRARDPIVVGRANPRDDLKAVLEGGAERLRAGISIAVFPQTTRTPVFDPAHFNTIGVKLAKRAQVPVVPDRAQDRRLGQRPDRQGNRPHRPGEDGAHRVRRTAAGAGDRRGRAPAGDRLHP